MKNLFKILFCILIVDLYFFSSVFTFTRGVNSKLILGVLGLVTFVIHSAKVKKMSVSKQMIVLTLLAVGVSLASLFSMNYNNTGDDAYFTYVISMLVWLAAAYMVAVSINYAYGKLSIELIADFIIAVSVIQCTIAILGELFVPVNNFIKLLVPGTTWLDSVDRMYGLGENTALDTGGIRYAIACILCAHMLVKTGEERRKWQLWYLFAYVYITIIGNMIARTTSVGSVIALVYLLGHLFSGTKVSVTKLRVFGLMTFLFALMFGVSVWLYNTNDVFQRNLRFGFEGFINLVETGEWHVTSNDKLRSMYVFPDNPKTWFIGDGYFNNPDGDPNYIGDITDGYYMNTDVGYLRFIFYFGIVGLSIFSLLILYAGLICHTRNPGDGLLFSILVLLNFIVWFKVATDCFFILAVFIALAYIKECSPSESLQ